MLSWISRFALIALAMMWTLFLILLPLKLCAVIDWSWWLVTLPLWWFIPGIVVALAGVAVVMLVVAWIDWS